MTTPGSDEVAALRSAFLRADANSALEGVLPTGFQLLQRERLFSGAISMDDYERLVLAHALARVEPSDLERAERDKYVAGDITIAQYAENVLNAARGLA